MLRVIGCSLALFFSLALAGAAHAAPAGAPLYRVTKVVSLGAPDRWDYLTFDAQSQRVYIAHGDRLTVVNGRTGALIGTVKGIPGGPHGIVIYHPTGTGYTDDGRAGEAVAFDLRTLKVTHRIKARADADDLVFDPVSGHVFVIDGDPGKLTVINPRNDRVVATIDGGGRLEAGVADGRGSLYVNGEAKREIVRIDARTNQVLAHWPIPGCESPHGIAMDRKSRRLFVTCENRRMFVVNADSGTVVTSLPIGAFTDGAAFDPKMKRAFSSNGDGSVTVVGEQGPNKFAVLGTVKTMSGGRTMTLDPWSGRLYVVAAHITVDESVPPSDYRHRYRVAPGSVKLLFLDPVHRTNNALRAVSAAPEPAPH